MQNGCRALKTARLAVASGSDPLLGQDLLKKWAKGSTCEPGAGLLSRYANRAHRRFRDQIVTLP